MVISRGCSLTEDSSIVALITDEVRGPEPVGLRGLRRALTDVITPVRWVRLAR